MIRHCVREAWCFAVDWTARIEYRETGNWYHRHVGAAAQLIWFKAHNNRVYRWLDEHTLPEWRFDNQVDAAYLKLTERPVARTLSTLDGAPNEFLVDLDADGIPVGIELLGPLVTEMREAPFKDEETTS